mmetsp:Transcript_136364/g.423730  ORF Transcript_136364/g.423730 Transcript_136364/m.423730 type:complete len:588 (+) Transcript_136364:145-1908(+)
MTLILISATVAALLCISYANGIASSCPSVGTGESCTYTEDEQTKLSVMLQRRKRAGQFEASISERVEEEEPRTLIVEARANDTAEGDDDCSKYVAKVSANVDTQVRDQFISSAADTVVFAAEAFTEAMTGGVQIAMGAASFGAGAVVGFAVDMFLPDPLEERIEGLEEAVTCIHKKMQDMQNDIIENTKHINNLFWMVQDLAKRPLLTMVSSLRKSTVDTYIPCAKLMQCQFDLDPYRRSSVCQKYADVAGKMVDHCSAQAFSNHFQVSGHWQKLINEHDHRGSQKITKALVGKKKFKLAREMVATYIAMLTTFAETMTAIQDWAAAICPPAAHTTHRPGCTAADEAHVRSGLTGFRDLVLDRIAGYAKVFGDYVWSVGWNFVDQSDIVHTKEIDGIAASKPCCTWVGWSWLERSGLLESDARMRSEQSRPRNRNRRRRSRRRRRTPAHYRCCSSPTQCNCRFESKRKCPWTWVMHRGGRRCPYHHYHFCSCNVGYLKKGCARKCAITDVVSLNNGAVRYNERYKIMGRLPEVLDKLVANLKNKKIALPPFKVPKQKTKWVMGKTAKAARNKMLAAVIRSWAARRRR